VDYFNQIPSINKESKKYRNQAIKQKEQLKLKIQKIRLSHEIRKHKWQDNMNLYENQRWNRVLQKGKDFLLRMLQTLIKIQRKEIGTVI